MYIPTEPSLCRFALTILHRGHLHGLPVQCGRAHDRTLLRESSEGILDPNDAVPVGIVIVDRYATQRLGERGRVVDLADEDAHQEIGRAHV